MFVHSNKKTTGCFQHLIFSFDHQKKTIKRCHDCAYFSKKKEKYRSFSNHNNTFFFLHCQFFKVSILTLEICLRFIRVSYDFLSSQLNLSKVNRKKNNQLKYGDIYFVHDLQDSQLLLLCVIC